MLLSWLLPLSLAPIVLLSISLPLERLTKRRIKASKGKPKPDRYTEEEKQEIMCEQLKNKARWLGLLLSEEKGPGSTCGLLLNPDKATYVINEKDEATKMWHYSWCKQIEASKKGQIFIIPPSLRTNEIACSSKESLHVLIGGVVWVRDNNGRLSYGTFTATKGGISGDNPNLFQGVEYKHYKSVFPLEERNILHLPEGIKSPVGEGKLYLEFGHLIYQNIRLLENPYPTIQHLDLFGHTMFAAVISNLDQELGITNSRNKLIGQSVCLVRFLQLWAAIRGDKAFVNLELQKIRSLLCDVENGEAGKREELLLEAGKFIYHNYGDHEKEPHSFLSILREQDDTIGKAFFTGLGDILDPEVKLEQDGCNKLSNELLFFVKSVRKKDAYPYLLKVPCTDNPENVATFKLVAILGIFGEMHTYGIRSDPSGIEHILNQSCYNVRLPYINTTNRFIASPQDLLFYFDDLVIYQHVQEDEAHFAKAKLADPQCPTTELTESFAIDREQ